MIIFARSRSTAWKPPPGGMEAALCVVEDPAIGALASGAAASGNVATPRRPSGHAWRRVAKKLPRQFVAFRDGRDGSVLGYLCGVLTVLAARVLQPTDDPCLLAQKQFQVKTSGKLLSDTSDFGVWTCDFRPFDDEVPVRQEDITGSLHWVFNLKMSFRIASGQRACRDGLPCVRLHSGSVDVLRSRPLECQLVTTRYVNRRAGIRPDDAQLAAEAPVAAGDRTSHPSRPCRSASRRR